MNFIDILQEYGVSYHADGSKTRSGWVNFNCPWCQHGDSYMGHRLGTRSVNCWSCGYHPLIGTVQLLTGLGWQEVKALVGGLPTDDYFEKRKVRGRLVLPEGLQDLNMAQDAYLEGRGLSPSILERIWGIRGIGLEGGLLAWRIWIPIHLDGEVVSWTTRRISDKDPSRRYHAASKEQSIIPIEDLIYGIDYCQSSILLVEGPLDVMTWGPGSGGLMGMRVSPPQMYQLSRIPVRGICMDNEEIAQEKARQLCRDLCVLPGKTINFRLQSGKDLASCDPEERRDIKQRMNEYA